MNMKLLLLLLLSVGFIGFLCWFWRMLTGDTVVSKDEEIRMKQLEDKNISAKFLEVNREYYEKHLSEIDFFSKGVFTACGGNGFNDVILNYLKTDGSVMSKVMSKEDIQENRINLICKYFVVK